VYSGEELNSFMTLDYVDNESFRKILKGRTANHVFWFVNAKEVFGVELNYGQML